NTHLGGRWGQRSNLSGTTDGNSYNQRFWATEPSLIWMRQSALRITSTLRYELRNNAPEYGGQEANIQSVMIDGRYSQSSAGIVQLRFTLSRIAYSGLATEPIAYAMLDGLRQGNNLLWYLNWQRRLGKGIELLLEYEGRKAGSDPIVNTGRMSLRAIL
ncbi:MAG: hypothetical protein IT256_03965, partial [Chitinophagaceae bacterium]|nr:hypothetical protein [Chitinophagaceae bacterium]